jgi:hypothetical protein
VVDVVGELSFYAGFFLYCMKGDLVLAFAFLDSVGFVAVELDDLS